MPLEIGSSIVVTAPHCLSHTRCCSLQLVHSQLCSLASALPAL